MSEDARDLLVHGIAAAEGHDKDEARFYLEWVLRVDCDVEQEAEAWYWLSTITDEPNEKRNSLENVLAAYPNHPEARRDLAILEGRLKAADIINPFQAVAPITPSASPNGEDVHRFVCPKCGGKMTYHPEHGGLFCQFCGHTESENGAATPKGSVGQQDWIAAIYTDKGHNWELPTERTLSCQNCGATVTLLPSQVSIECPFCGTPQVITGEEESLELIQPGGVVPFAFDASAALVHAREFLTQQRFRPSDLDERSALIPARPVYLPFWTFEVGGQATWNGYIPELEYKHVRMVPTGGVLGGTYEEVMVPGTRSLPEELLSQLTYDTTALVPYSPELLADWPAEIYSVALADAAVSAHAQAHERNKQQIQREVEDGISKAVQNVHVDSTDLAIINYKLVLLPVWLTGYTYKSKQFTLVVNGQSGQVSGQIPRTGVQRLLGEVFGAG